MADREKIEKGLRICTSKEPCNGCPYLNERNCSLSMVADALALLKEQDAVEPEVEVLNEVDRLYRCPRCHKYFFHRKQKYCDQCGQAVKWDG